MAVTILELGNNDEIKGFSKIRRLESESLFEGRAEILIVHKDEEYRLRITKNDKLILTK
jgi:hemin uptake protein HemP